MNTTFLPAIDLLGTIAFAISGAFAGVHKDMDLFGINVLAVTTACGGGLIRDLLIGITPPAACLNPFYVTVAAVTANIIFLILKMHKAMPARAFQVYDSMLFVFDTLGLAAFTVNGVMVGVSSGHSDNLFLLTFLGFLTGVGGGVLRDLMADQVPDIFRKHIYALAAIAGGLTTGLVLPHVQDPTGAMLAGFAVVGLRCLAKHYRWNLPKIS
ncbi:MAG: trimeric intracellular cation channel family protein [Solobacterium sp.]|nr:trimeric intracellular cation channel family protein [Solobacterium sp.]